MVKRQIYYRASLAVFTAREFKQKEDLNTKNTSTSISASIMSA